MLVEIAGVVGNGLFDDVGSIAGAVLMPQLFAQVGGGVLVGLTTAGFTALDLDVETVHTTQDVAVSVAFLITEIIEYAMLHRPDDPVEVSLRRTSELTARLMLSSPVLVPDDEETPGKQQFERVVGGLAKQLRSDLDRKLGRYSVDLPVFPDS